jgi:phosphoribosylformimino-5-aminoimidazole carboxamide ribonucleotide (ProFAR) isomerase
MDDRTFTEFSTPIMNKQGAPWLKKFTENGIEVIRVVDLENHRARAATEREILDGKYYKDHAEYLADRAA